MLQGHGGRHAQANADWRIGALPCGALCGAAASAFFRA